MGWFVRTPGRPSPPRRGYRPVLEILEDRLAPASVASPVLNDTTGLTGALVGIFSSPVANSALLGAGSGSAVPPPAATVSALGPPEALAGQSVIVAGGVGSGQAGPVVISEALAGLSGSIGLTPGSSVPPAVVDLVFTAFSLVTFVPPQTPPPRAVTLFAPGGSGAVNDNAPANPVASPDPFAPVTPPSRGPAAIPGPALGAPVIPSQTPGQEQPPAPNTGASLIDEDGGIPAAEQVPDSSRKAPANPPSATPAPADSLPADLPPGQTSSGLPGRHDPAWEG